MDDAGLSAKPLLLPLLTLFSVFVTTPLPEPMSGLALTLTFVGCCCCWSSGGRSLKWRRLAAVIAEFVVVGRKLSKLFMTAADVDTDADTGAGLLSAVAPLAPAVACWSPSVLRSAEFERARGLSGVTGAVGRP